MNTFCDLPNNLPIHWIVNTNQLNQLVDELHDLKAVALDTEFIKRDTYYPKLALIQLNTGQNIYLIDAPSLDPLALQPFWQALSVLPVMIWHACAEDLGIFYLLSGLPALTNIFDTQIALSYLTGQLQVGYQKAIHTVLGVEVDKGESQSDWLARPLTKEQENYAINDVRYLLPLYQQLNQQLAEKNLVEQLWQDCQDHAYELYQNQQVPDEDQYLSAVNFRHSGIQRTFLQELLAWRERLARATNQPRTFILRKQGIKELVELMPTSLRQLHKQTSIHRTIIETYGEEILRIVRMAKQTNKQNHPPAVIAGYHSKDKRLQKSVNTLIKNYSEQTGIPDNVLMRKKWLSDLYEMVALDKPIETLSKSLLGWRRQWLESSLLPFLKQHKSELRKGMSLT